MKGTMITTLQRYLLFALVMLIGTTASSALAAGKETAKITWSLTNASIKAAPGDTVNIQLKAEVPQGWHTYSATKLNTSPYTAIAADPAAPFKISGPITAAPVELFKPGTDENTFDETIEEIKDSGTFTIPITISADAKPGELTGNLNIRTQVCKAGPGGMCIPMKATIPVTLTVTEKSAAPEKPKEHAVLPLPSVPSSTAGTSGGSASASALQSAKTSGLFSYMLFAMGAGFIALATPCVFPMIPITISFFTKRMKSTWLKAVIDASVFAIGIVATFTGIGFVFALVFGAASISKLVANGYFNLAFAALVILFALNLFGVFELQVPSFILNRLNKSSSKGDGFVSVLLMGVLFSLTSFTCSGPFVGQTLVDAAHGAWFWPIFGMLAFSSAFAFPFFLLALFPNLLKSMPKSGGWLNAVKVVMGFVEIAWAMKYLSGSDLVWHWGLLTREVFLSIWIAVSVLTTFYLLGWFQLTHDTPVEKIGGVRVIFASCFLAAGVWMTTGLKGGDLGMLNSMLPPVDYPYADGSHVAADSAHSNEPKLTWLTDLDAARAESARTKKPLFIDFTGLTCTNCNAMERNVFPRPAISALLNNFVRVRLYTDGQSTQEEIERADRNNELKQKRFNSVALPLYAIVSPDDKNISQSEGMSEAVDFEKFLSLGYAAASGPQADSNPVASSK